MLYGKMDFNGNKEVNCAVEFEKNEYGNELVLHLPANVSTSNWYHGVRVCCDLP